MSEKNGNMLDLDSERTRFVKIRGIEYALKNSNELTLMETRLMNRLALEAKAYFDFEDDNPGAEKAKLKVTQAVNSMFVDPLPAEVLASIGLMQITALANHFFAQVETEEPETKAST